MLETTWMIKMYKRKQETSTPLCQYPIRDQKSKHKNKAAPKSRSPHMNLCRLGRHTGRLLKNNSVEFPFFRDIMVRTSSQQSPVFELKLAFDPHPNQESNNKKNKTYHPLYFGWLKISVNTLKTRSGNSKIDGNSGPSPQIGNPSLLTGR